MFFLRACRVCVLVYVRACIRVCVQAVLNGGRHHGGAVDRASLSAGDIRRSQGLGPDVAQAYARPEPSATSTPQLCCPRATAQGHRLVGDTPQLGPGSALQKYRLDRTAMLV